MALSPDPPAIALLTRPPPTTGGEPGPAGLGAGAPGPPSPELTDFDIHLLGEGTHDLLFDKLGAHPLVRGGTAGIYFAVWAPNAERVSVVGEFNRWDARALPMARRGTSGVWEGFAPGLAPGAGYKYRVVSHGGEYSADKADPFAFHAELSPGKGSIVWDLAHEWGDDEWMKTRGARAALTAPITFYEVHLGSWMRVAEEGDRFLSYREIAPKLSAYVKRMGFTHVELLPVMEHPFYGSWGYQVTGYFAPTSRYGTPQDFMYLVDHLHQEGIGVILDWVPSHFPTDEHGLGYFDGTHLFEHADPRQGFHPDWNSFIFNYGRNEVRAFLLSSARFWLDRYHIDGLRVDAVASMLYLDYSRGAGEWIPNVHGGRENLEAISLLQRLNEGLFRVHPDIQTIAEESTSWPRVSRPLYLGGLGFGMKWDMGWMHDSLAFMQQDPVFRQYQHNSLTFRNTYAATENFVLPLSHDEVVHGKGSLYRKMPGDEWQRFANLRLLFANMYAQQGKKLLFMGCEFGQDREWNHDASLDWPLAGQPLHAGLSRLVEDLNRLYRGEPSLHEQDFNPLGFEWIDCSDAAKSIVAMLRLGTTTREAMLVALNFTPVPRPNYRLGAPYGGEWKEMLNTDATVYGGSGQGNLGGVEASPVSLHGRDFSLTLTLPPLGAVFLKGITPPAAPPPAPHLSGRRPGGQPAPPLAATSKPTER